MNKLLILPSSLFLILACNNTSISSEEQFVKDYYECWEKWDFKKLATLRHPDFYKDLSQLVEVKEETSHTVYEEAMTSQYKNLNEFLKLNEFSYKDFEIGHKEEDLSIVYFTVYGKAKGRDYNTKMVFLLKKDKGIFNLVHEELYKNSEYNKKNLKLLRTLVE